MLAYALYLLYEYVPSLFLIPARPCPMKLWHLCDTRTAERFPVDFFVSQMQIKDQGPDLPKQVFSKNCLDIFIAKSGGTRHLQGLTARSGNSFNSNLKSRGRNSHRAVTTRGKHTNDHTEFACLLQLLPGMRLQENMSEGSAVTSLCTRQLVLAQLPLLILVKNGVMLVVKDFAVEAECFCGFACLVFAELTCSTFCSGVA